MKEKIKEFMKLTKEFIIKNKIVVVFSVLILFLILGYMVGSINSSKESVMKKFAIGLEEGSASKLKDVIRVNNKKISKKELKPLIDYYKGENSEVNTIIDSLNSTGKSKVFELIEDKGIFFDDYYINLKTLQLKINSNYKDASIYLNDNNIKQGEVIKNLIPGSYKISGTLKNKYGDMKATENIVLMDNKDIELKLDGILVSVESEFKDAKVLINGEDSGIKVSDFKNIGPMPSDGSIKLSLSNDFPWGTITGEEVTLEDVPNVALSLKITNDKLWSDIDNSMNIFYKSVFNSLNSEDKNEIQLTTEDTKNKIYSILEEKYFILKNKYTLISLNLDKDKSNFQYKNGEYVGTVVCDVNYDTSKVLFGIGREEKSKKFLTKVKFKDNQWIITDIENFSL
ncbi:hypothetical protein [Clostridium sp. Ade.TY]|uniref:TcaA 3rd/4th domain-containing protein n=1 Tax=Clostridium sp. Ade.TY TaxID=1391647 RepID=UPI0003F93859|nr:hypothetical protein [Clostridium sp. Ade.TY]